MRAAPPTSRAVSVETRGATPAPAPTTAADDDASTAGASPDTADDTTTLQSFQVEGPQNREISLFWVHATARPVAFGEFCRESAARKF